MNTISNKTVDELNLLFGMAPPAELREHLTTVYFSYIRSFKPDEVPVNFHTISEDIHFLIRFLTVAEKNKRLKE